MFDSGESNSDHGEITSGGSVEGLSDSAFSPETGGTTAGETTTVGIVSDSTETAPGTIERDAVSSERTTSAENGFSTSAFEDNERDMAGKAGRSSEGTVHTEPVENTAAKAHTEPAENTEATPHTEPAENTETAIPTNDVQMEIATHDLPANERVVIDGTWYRTDDHGHPHMIYDKENADWGLLPNNSYEVNGYRYQTDDRGRISHAEATLQLEPNRQSLNANVKDMQDGDERGHVIADRFGASNRIDNLAPQLHEINDGRYKALESHFANLVADGHTVYAEYDLLYQDASARPNVTVVSYKVDNGDWNQMQIFNNIRESA